MCVCVCSIHAHIHSSVFYHYKMQHLSCFFFQSVPIYVNAFFLYLLFMVTSSFFSESSPIRLWAPEALAVIGLRLVKFLIGEGQQGWGKSLLSNHLTWPKVTLKTGQPGGRVRVASIQDTFRLQVLQQCQDWVPFLQSPVEVNKTRQQCGTELWSKELPSWIEVQDSMEYGMENTYTVYRYGNSSF